MGNAYTNMERANAECRDCGARFIMRVWDEDKMCLACKKRIEEIKRIIETCNDGRLGLMG